MKKLCCFLGAAILIFTSAVSADALTKGQKSIGDIGVKITWFDFGKSYKNYYIQDDMGTGFYALTMTNDSTGAAKTEYVNGKGEPVKAPSIPENDEEFRTVESNGRKGVVDRNGSLIFEDKDGKYKGFTYLGSGIFAAKIEENKYDFLDSTGALLSKSPYTNSWLRSVSEERLSVSRDGKYGFLDLSGNEIVPLIYEEAFPFQEGVAAVCREGKWGFIDKAGTEVILPVYDQVHSPFHNGLTAASLNGKWGLIDKEGNAIFPFEYDYVYEEEGGYFIVQKEGKTFPLDASGKRISDEYSYMRMDPDGRIYVRKDWNGSEASAYLDQNRVMLTGFKEFFLYPRGDQLYLGEKSGDYPPGVTPPHDYLQKFALLDSGGNNLTGFKYSNTGAFRNDFQVVNLEYYGTAGLVNQYGAEVLPTIFEDILLTEEGYAFVTVNDPGVGGNTRVGYFKIPDSYAEIKGSRPVTVYLDGVELYLDPEPVIKNGRTMVPMRKIFESLGAKIEWNGSTKTVTAESGSQTLKLTIGSTAAYANGSEVRLDAAPYLQNDTTLVPLRFVSEYLGADVRWDNALRRVIITDNAGQ